MSFTNTMTYFHKRKNTPEFSRIKQLAICHEVSPVKFSVFKAVKKNTWMMLHRKSTTLAATAHYYPTANYNRQHKAINQYVYIQCMLLFFIFFFIFLSGIDLVFVSSTDLLWYEVLKNATLNANMKIKSGKHL